MFTSPIQRRTRNTIHTKTVVVSVEQTPKGGHFVSVAGIEQAWVGLYRCEARLVLVARCKGDPPRELELRDEIRAALLEMIREDAAKRQSTYPTSPKTADVA